MCIPFQKHVSWTLITLLAVMTGVGEGLHYVPGCGHGAPVGDGTLFLGIELQPPRVAFDCPEQAERSDGPGIPIYDEDQCAICSFVGQGATKGKYVQFVLAVPFMHELPATATYSLPALVAHCFHARAPPLI